MKRSTILLLKSKSLGEEFGHKFMKTVTGKSALYGVVCSSADLRSAGWSHRNELKTLWIERLVSYPTMCSWMKFVEKCPSYEIKSTATGSNSPKWRPAASSAPNFAVNLRPNAATNGVALKRHLIDGSMSFRFMCISVQFDGNFAK